MDINHIFQSLSEQRGSIYVDNVFVEKQDSSLSSHGPQPWIESRDGCHYRERLQLVTNGEFAGRRMPHGRILWVLKAIAVNRDQVLTLFPRLNTQEIKRISQVKAGSDVGAGAACKHSFQIWPESFMSSVLVKEKVCGQVGLQII